jgi:hypothetical protein
METSEPEDHEDLVGAMFDAIGWMIWPGGKEYYKQWGFERLARATFKLVRDEVKELYGSEFDAVERQHRQIALPTNEN